MHEMHIDFNTTSNSGNIPATLYSFLMPFMSRMFMKIKFFVYFRTQKPSTTVLVLEAVGFVSPPRILFSAFRTFTASFR